MTWLLQQVGILRGNREAGYRLPVDQDPDFGIWGDALDSGILDQGQQTHHIDGAGWNNCSNWADRYMQATSAWASSWKPAARIAARAKGSNS